MKGKIKYLVIIILIIAVSGLGLLLYKNYSGKAEQEESLVGYVDNVATIEELVPTDIKVVNANKLLDELGPLEPVYLKYLGKYVRIDVPKDLEYITDYSNFLASTDGTVQVRLLSGNIPEDIGKMLKMRGVTNISSKTIYSNEGKNKVFIGASRYSDNLAVSVKTYNNNEAFTSILKSMDSYNGLIDLPTIKVVKSNHLPKVEKLDEIDIINAGVPEYCNIFRCSDSSFVVQKKEQIKAEDNVQQLANLIGANSGSTVNVYKSSNGRVLLYSGYYSAVVERVNYNTSISYFGIGGKTLANLVGLCK